MINYDDIFNYIDNNDIANVKKIINDFKRIEPNKNFNSEIRGLFNYTPLHKAVLYNKFDIVEILIKEKADPTIRILQSTYPPDGILALYLAEDFGKHNITKILKLYMKDWEFDINIMQKFFSIKDNPFKKNKKKLQKQYNVIFTIMLIGNRLGNTEMECQEPLIPYLPNEMWFLILSFCRLNELQ